MSIAILTPSRGRPDRFREMVHAIRETADTNITVYLATDDDDVTYPNIDGVIHLCEPRRRLAGWTNRLASYALDDGHDILGFLGDDHRPRTPGWDTRIQEAFERMGSGLAYGRDGLQDERLPTAPFWTSDVIRALGWFYPPVLMHLYADDYWKLLADDLGRRAYLPDVYIEHMHPSATDARGHAKAEADSLNAENDSFYDRDRQAFEHLVRDSHPQILRRVQDALGA